jgi:hypothetical protein
MSSRSAPKASLIGPTSATTSRPSPTSPGSKDDLVHVIVGARERSERLLRVHSGPTLTALKVKPDELGDSCID